MNNEGQTFGYWKVIAELGGGKILCECICGARKVNDKYHVTHGDSQSCGCMSAGLKSQALIDSLKGQYFGEWKVTEELGYGKVLCNCSCGKQRVIQKSTLKSGRSKSCGHKRKTVYIDSDELRQRLNTDMDDVLKQQLADEARRKEDEALAEAEAFIARVRARRELERIEEEKRKLLAQGGY